MVIKIRTECILIFLCLNVSYAATVNITLGANIQAAIDANPAGTVFMLAAGTYTMQTAVPKDGDQLIGALDSSGARLTTLTGAQPLSGFTQDAYGNYVATTTQTTPGRIQGYCDPAYPRCMYPEDFFYDDQPYQNTDGGPSALGPGQFYFDYPNGLIYFRPQNPADDPNQHKVEYSRVPAAVSGGASDVVVANLIVEKYAAPDQFGAIGEQYPGPGWIVQNNELRLNHGEGLHVTSNSQVLNNYTHDNGESGMGGTGLNILVQGNEIARNNYTGTDHNFECGGFKFAASDGLIVRDNYSHDNNGPGMWTDISSIRTLYENNQVMNNARAGIFHETSYDAVIRNNTVSYNGSFAPDDWYWNAQIQISTSQNVEVYGNVVTVDSGNNGNGIMLLQQDRTSEPCTYGPCRVANDYVHDNDIIVIGTRWHGSSGVVEDYVGLGDAFDPASNNRFEGDRYSVTDVNSAAYWQWVQNFQTFPEFQSFGLESAGSVTHSATPRDCIQLKVPRTRPGVRLGSCPEVSVHR